MSDQNASPDVSSASEKPGPAETWGVPRPGALRRHRPAVPHDVVSAAGIVRVLGIVGLIGTVLALFGLMMLASIAAEEEGLGLLVGIVTLSVLASAILSVAFLVQSPRVREGDVRACRTVAILLGISIAFRVLGLFPVQLNLGSLVNIALLVTTIVALGKLRSADAKYYYARA